MFFIASIFYNDIIKIRIGECDYEDEKISYNALDFKMVNGEGAEASTYSITAEEDVTLSSGNLDPKGKVEGVIIWEQKENDTGLKVRYYKNALFDKEYTFQWTLDQ